MAERPRVSVVVSVSAGAAGVTETLERIDAYFKSVRIEREIVLVVDGTSQGGPHEFDQVLRGREPCQLLRLRERLGVGAAVRSGFLASTARQVLVVPGRPDTTIEAYKSLADLVRDRDLDVAVGGGGGSGPLSRGIRRLMHLPQRALRPELVLLDRDRTRPVVERMVVNGEAWAIELLYVCLRFSLRVAEIPLSCAERARNPSILDLADIARVRWRFRRGGYNPSVDAPR